MPELGVGIGLRTLDELGARRPPVDYLELSTDCCFGDGEEVATATSGYRLTLRGAGFSIGSADPLDLEYVATVAALADRLDAAWVSAPLAWLGVDGWRGLTLLPLPYNRDTLDYLVDRVATIRQRLGRPLLIENPPSYLELASSTISEPRFLAELAAAADCGLRIDLAAVQVSSRNHGRDPLRYLDELPSERIREIQLAGHADLARHSVATRDRPIEASVWCLYERLCDRVSCATVVRWDRRRPDLTPLEAEAAKVARHRANGEAG